MTSPAATNGERIAEMKKRAAQHEQLLPIGNTETRVSVGKQNSDDDEASKYAWSAIEARLIQSSNRLLSFVQTGKIVPGSPKSQLVEGLLGMFREHFNDPCCNRDGRLEALEELAGKWLAQMRRTGSEQAAEGINLAAVSHWNTNGAAAPAPASDVHDLLHLWSEADAIMNRIRTFGDQFGPEHVARDYDAWIEAKASREIVEKRASSLPPPEYQYFWCRVEQFRIYAERADELAKGVVETDYTAVKKRIVAGEEIHQLVGDLPWEYQEAYNLVFGSLSGGDDFREIVMSTHTKTLPYRLQPPRRRRGFRFGFGRRGDDEGDEYGPPDYGGPDYEDEPEPPRQAPRNRQRGRRRR